jgi:hypothetical protein
MNAGVPASREPEDRPHVLHDDRRGTFPVDDVVYAHDPGMIQPSRHPRVEPNPLDQRR